MTDMDSVSDEGFALPSPQAEDLNNATSQTVLEKKVEDLERRIREERFLWIVVLVIVFDALAFHVMPSWGSSVVIGVLELALILVLARILDVSDVVRLTDRVIDAVRRTPS